jgi:SMC interacting uncharacterized protein involved in chromosome segregation
MKTYYITLNAKETLDIQQYINKAVQMIADLKDNSLRLDKELAEANADKFPVSWEDASKSSYAHTCHIQLMERLKREFNI